MIMGQIKERALFQTGNDADDLADFLPFLDQYVNDGYDRLLHAWEKKHVGDDGFPVLSGDGDTPLLPDWAHDAVADWATWCLYRNGNPQKQQRGMIFAQSLEEMVARLYAEGGAKGKRDRFINIYP